MRCKILYTVMLGLMGSNLFASIEIPVAHPACRYAVQPPAGWDTIPLDTIKSKVDKIEVAVGLYPAAQERYFDGSYVLISFMPTIKTLSSFTFEQIVADVAALNKQSELTSDTLSVRFDKIVPDAQNYCLHSYFSIWKDTVAVQNCQSLYLTKFGYVAALSYRKSGAAPPDEAPEPLSGLIQVHPDYQYAAPKKGGITFWHLLASLAIGLLAYALIAKFTKKRAAS